MDMETIQFLILLYHYVLLVRRCFAPMNPIMWEQSSVQRNVNQLKNDGWKMIDPQTVLACGSTGIGRLANLDTILEVINRVMIKSYKRIYYYTSTYEYIDPVRFIEMHHPEKMGASIAVAAKSQGWFVNFITGPVHPYEL